MTTRTPCVVGLNLGHDGGAALITEHTTVAISEERINRTRYSPGWQAALLYCLHAAGLQLNDIDQVVVSGIGNEPPSWEETRLGHFGIRPDRTVAVDHHLSHAYTAYCLSPSSRPPSSSSTAAATAATPRPSTPPPRRASSASAATRPPGGGPAASVPPTRP
ncbi:carbamoyltransferase N-terminal domain-containing protein [Streptomyces stramineus]